MGWEFRRINLLPLFQCNIWVTNLWENPPLLHAVLMLFPPHIHNTQLLQAPTGNLQSIFKFLMHHTWPNWEWGHLSQMCWAHAIMEPHICNKIHFFKNLSLILFWIISQCIILKKLSPAQNTVSLPTTPRSRLDPCWLKCFTILLDPKLYHNIGRGTTFPAIYPSVVYHLPKGDDLAIFPSSPFQNWSCFHNTRSTALLDLQYINRIKSALFSRSNYKCTV